MPRLPRKPLSRKKDSQFFNVLVKAVSNLEDEKDIKNFLEDLLSDSERAVLSKRLQVAVLLVREEKYQKICETLGVGNSTVAQVSNWLRSGADNLKEAAENINKLRESKKENPQ